MRTFKLNKLVRDGIVESTIAQGGSVDFIHLSHEKLDEALLSKLVEEASELAVDGRVTAEGLADVQTVIDEIARRNKINQEQIAQTQKSKLERIGGFATGIFVRTLSLPEDNEWAKYYAADPRRFPEVSKGRMRVYISARAKTRLDEVKDIHTKMMEMGHEITYDWTNARVKRPYRDSKNRKHNIETQADMLKKAATADIFIMLDEPGLRGAYVELGAFLTDCLENSEGRRAYIVGPDSNEREFIFESPDYVIFAQKIDEVYRDLV